jgi:hypothetical protein
VTGNNYGVIDTDNYGGDYPDEKFIVACWLCEETAEKIAKLLNEESGAHATRYYRVVEIGYKLQPGFEP